MAAKEILAQLPGIEFFLLAGDIFLKTLAHKLRASQAFGAGDAIEGLV